MDEGEALLCVGITHEEDAAEMLSLLSCLVNVLSNFSDFVEIILSDILFTHDFFKNCPRSVVTQEMGRNNKEQIKIALLILVC